MFRNGRCQSKLQFQVMFFSYEAYFLRYYQKTWFLLIVLFLVTATMLCNISIKKTKTLEPTHWGTFLRNFSRIRSVVSEEKIFEKLRKKLTTDDRRRTTDGRRRTQSDDKSLHCLRQGELKSSNILSLFKSYDQSWSLVPLLMVKYRMISFVIFCTIWNIICIIPVVQLYMHLIICW